MKNILKASEGKILTNGSAYGKTVYLGCTDKEENWHEISEEEYAKIKEKENERNEEAY